MPKKQVRFSEVNIKRLENTGVCKDDLDSAFEKLLDMYDDIMRVLMFDDEPDTELVKLLKKKWCRKVEVIESKELNIE